MTRTPRPETALPNRRKRNRGGSDGMGSNLSLSLSGRPVAVKAGGWASSAGLFQDCLTKRQSRGPLAPLPAMAPTVGGASGGPGAVEGLGNVGWRPGIARVPDTCNVIALDFFGPCLTGVHGEGDDGGGRSRRERLSKRCGSWESHSMTALWRARLVVPPGWEEKQHIEGRACSRDAEMQRRAVGNIRSSSQAGSRRHPRVPILMRPPWIPETGAAIRPDG